MLCFCCIVPLSLGLMSVCDLLFGYFPPKDRQGNLWVMPEWALLRAKCSHFSLTRAQCPSLCQRNSVLNWYFVVFNLLPLLSLCRTVACRGMVTVLRVLLTRCTRALQDWVWKEQRRLVKLAVDAGVNMYSSNVWHDPQ